MGRHGDTAVGPAGPNENGRKANTPKSKGGVTFHGLFFSGPSLFFRRGIHGTSRDSETVTSVPYTTFTSALRERERERELY